ncbi:hypothetical protein NBRC10513_005714 [Rhodotorula toruloides]
MGLIHYALKGMRHFVRLFAPYIVDLDQDPVTLPDCQYLHLRSLSVHCVISFYRGPFRETVPAFELCPNLVHLDLSAIEILHRSPLLSLPLLQRLTFRKCQAGRTAGLYQLLTFFQQSLRHLDLDDVPAPPNLHGDPLPDLNKFPSLETLQVTLRHCYTEVNEHILPANSLGQNFPRDGIDTSDDGGLAYMLDWLDTLPRPEQITLVFSLPPLAHPAMRKANKRVWRNCFQQLRVCSWWDAKVPKTVEKVDCSAIFDEDEE